MRNEWRVYFNVVSDRVGACCFVIEAQSHEENHLLKDEVELDLHHTP